MEDNSRKHSEKMEGVSVPGSPPKAVLMETSHEDTTLGKSEIVGLSQFSKETSNTKNSLETTSPKPEIGAVINNVEPHIKENIASNSQTEPRTVSVSEDSILPVPRTVSVSEDSILPVPNSAGIGKEEVIVGNIERKDDENVDRLMYKTIEGVSKAVTELKLDQTKEHVVEDNIERLQPEDESREVANTQGTEEDRNDPVIKDPVRVNEEQMDVDPHQTVIVTSAVDGREEEVEEVKRDDIPDNKDEDEIDEAWKSDDFNLPPSDDDENYFMEPPPEVIVELYQKLDEGNILDLEWTCLGRRTPVDDGEKMEVEEIVESNQEEKINQPAEEDPTEFDFDIDAVIQNKITPRRIPGFDPKGSGSAKKRVAKMDKVLDDIRRFTKINEEMVKTGDIALPPPLQTDMEMTPQRPLGKFHIRRDLDQ